MPRRVSKNNRKSRAVRRNVIMANHDHDGWMEVALDCGHKENLGYYSSYRKAPKTAGCLMCTINKRRLEKQQ